MNKYKRKESKPIGAIQNIGGHLINPPEECKYKKQWPDGSIWIDLSVCQAVCKQQCGLFKWFKKAHEEERIKYLIDNNVYYPWGKIK